MNDITHLTIIEDTNLQNKIYTIRGAQAMIDSELASLYGVETKVLNQAVKRNLDRFPTSFRFQLNDVEKDELVTNCDQFKNLKHSYSNPYAFTEQGVAMLSAVLRSKKAIQISVQIMDAFVNMRRFIASHASLFHRIDNIERKQIEYKIETDNKLDRIFTAIEEREIKPKQGIFFDGQIFDAYKLLADIIKSAKKSIYLVDNYIDESVLTIFSKRKSKIIVKIFTKTITKQMKLDVKKYNLQYPKVDLIQLNKAHDRFLIIDQKIVYHFGASLKDLGKKWFAFTKMENDSLALIEQLEKL